MSQFTEDWDKIVADPRWEQKDAKQRRQIARNYINDNKYIYGLTGTSPEVKRVLSGALGGPPKQSRLSRIGEGLLAGVKYPTVGSIVTEAVGGEQDLPGPIDIAKEALRGKGDAATRALISALSGVGGKYISPKLMQDKNYAFTQEDVKKLTTPNVPYARPDLTYMGSAALGMLPEQTAEMLSGMKLGRMAAEYIPGASELRRRAVQAGAGFIAGAAFPGVAGPTAYVLTPEERKENIAEMARLGVLIGGGFGAAGGFLFPAPKATGTQAATQVAPPAAPPPSPTILGQQISPANIVLQPPPPPTAPSRQVRVGQPLPAAVVKPPLDDIMEQSLAAPMRQPRQRFVPAPAPRQPFPQLGQPLVTEAPQMGPLTAPEPFISPVAQGRVVPQQELANIPARTPAVEGPAPQVRGITQAPEQAQDILSPQEIEQAFRLFSTTKPPAPAQQAPRGMMSAARGLTPGADIQLGALARTRNSLQARISNEISAASVGGRIAPEQAGNINVLQGQLDMVESMIERLGGRLTDEPMMPAVPRTSPDPEAMQAPVRPEVPVAPQLPVRPEAQVAPPVRPAAAQIELPVPLQAAAPAARAVSERLSKVKGKPQKLKPEPGATAPIARQAEAPASQPVARQADEPSQFTSNVAQEIAGGFKEMGNATKAAGRKRVVELVEKQGYVEFKRPETIKQFSDENPNWVTETTPSGATRFSPPPKLDLKKWELGQSGPTAPTPVKPAPTTKQTKPTNDEIQAAKQAAEEAELELEATAQRLGENNPETVAAGNRAAQLAEQYDALRRAAAAAKKAESAPVSKPAPKAAPEVGATSAPKGKMSSGAKAAEVAPPSESPQEMIRRMTKEIEQPPKGKQVTGIRDKESQPTKPVLPKKKEIAKTEAKPKPKQGGAVKEALEVAKEFDAKEAKKGKPRPAIIRLIEDEGGFMDPVGVAQAIANALRFGGRGIAEVLRFATRALNRVVKGIYGGGGALIKTVAQTAAFGAVARNLPKAGDVIEKYGSAAKSAIGDFAGDRLVDYASKGTSTASKTLMRRVGTILKTDSRQTAKRFKEALRAPAKTSNAAFNAIINEIKRFAFGEFNMSKDLVDAIAAIDNETVIFLRDLQKYAGELLVKYKNDPDELARVGRDLENRAYAGSDPEILRGKAILKNISKAIYDVGGIKKGAYELYGETGSYLPRIYLKWLKVNEDRSGLSLKLFRLANEDPSFSGYKHRGIQELITRKKFLEDRAKGIDWIELDKASRRYRATIARKTGKKLTDEKVLVWRDLTEAEQNKLNREWNPLPSMVKLYDTALKDLKSGKLFEYLSTGSDANGRYAMTPDELGINVKHKSKLPPEFTDSSGQRWVYLDPNAVAKFGTIKKFGNLGGSYVRSDIASYMTFHNDRGDFRRWLAGIKRYTGIDFFKQMKTVWATRYYVNNVFNAMPMVELSGGSVLDAPNAIIDIANNAPIIQQLIDENFIQQGVLTKQLAAEAKSILERDLAKSGLTTQKSLASALQEASLNLGKTKETLQLISQATDDMWRLTVYQGLRRRQGLSHEEAKEIANGAIYDSRTVTSPAAAVAEVVSPFAKVTAWMMDKTAEYSIANPHKLAYLMGVGSLIPYALASMQASQERLSAEEEVIDDYLKGTKLFGTNMSLGIGFPEKIRVWSSGSKAWYWDTKNFGGLQGLAADVGSTGFDFLPQSLKPGGPWYVVVQAIMNWNEFKKQEIRARDNMQRDITIDSDFISSPVSEFFVKSLGPSGIGESFSIARSMLGLPETSGRTIGTWTKILNALGLKIREVDLDTQVEKSIGKGEAALNQWRDAREKDFKVYERMIEPDSKVSQDQIDKQLDRLRRWDEKIEELSQQELERQTRVIEGASR